MGATDSTDRAGPVFEANRTQRTGLVTILFTDMVGSTALKQRLGDKAGAVFFERHHQVVRQTLQRCEAGREIETAGDSFLITFGTPLDAVRFALLLQVGLRELSESCEGGTQDRIGIHVGEVVIKDEEVNAVPKDLYGIQIDMITAAVSAAKERK